MKFQVYVFVDTENRAPKHIVGNARKLPVRADFLFRGSAPSFSWKGKTLQKWM
jgi:hypothetical protein